MKYGVIALVLLASLAACKPAERRDPPRPVAVYTPQPLYPRPDCVRPRRLTSAERLICGHKGLDWLDRMLHQHWAALRDDASPRVLRRLDRRQNRFLHERRQCEDVQCVADVYHRYLPPQETPTPAAAPVRKPVSRPRPKPAPVATPSPERPHRPELTADSCVTRAGAPVAERLAAQCRRVNPGKRGRWACAVERSCGALKRAIDEGCNATYRKPRFCPTLNPPR